jgi:NTP pyrophosphatase (non-canonical NTP hydrolase)
MSNPSDLNLNKSLNEYTNDNRTNFQKVYQWNQLFGVPVHDIPQVNILKDNPNTVESGMRLIREEINELEDGIKKNNYVEVVDALGDSIVVICGLAARIGINLDEVVHIINDSNMSKLCKTEEEAIKTVEWYKTNCTRYDSPCYRKSGNHWVVYNKSTNKILKCINWQIANIGQYLNNKLN